MVSFVGDEIVRSTELMNTLSGISRWSQRRKCWTNGGRCCVRLMWKCPRRCFSWSCFCQHSCTLMNMNEALGTTSQLYCLLYVYFLVISD